MQKVKKPEKGLFIGVLECGITVKNSLKVTITIYKTKERIKSSRTVLPCVQSTQSNVVNMKNLIKDVSDNLCINVLAFSFSLKKWG